jgi:hypothetical protein
MNPSSYLIVILLIIITDNPSNYLVRAASEETQVKAQIQQQVQGEAQGSSNDFAGVGTYTSGGYVRRKTVKRKMRHPQKPEK